MMSRRRGFSLVEVLVIAAIIAILLALMLPAIGKVRGAANRTRGMNNMRQLALGVHNYTDSNGHFPMLCDFGKGSKTGHGVASMFFEMLPYIEQDSVYKLFDAKSPTTYYDSKVGAAKTNLDVFLSPDDTSAEGAVTTTAEVKVPNAKEPFASSFTGTYATTSFAANGMVFVPEGGFPNITDGTSNTLMLGERYRACKKSDKAGDTVYNLWGMGAYGASTPSFALALPSEEKYPTSKPALEQFVPPESIKDGEISGKCGSKEMKYSTLGKEINAPGGFQVMPNKEGKCDPRVLQALRPNGMIVTMLDASTRMVSAKISASTFWMAATPKGGEVLGADW